MNNLFITVFTPTFNRAKLLEQVYNSLEIQKFKNFEWLVVDDGSTDNTEEIINTFIATKKVRIRYYKKNNGGKHSAINFGIQKAKGELFILLDSDDIFLTDSLQKYSNFWKLIYDKKDIAGILGLSIYKDNKIVGTSFIKTNWEASMTDVYFKYNVKGDKAIAFKTSILKEYPFPVDKDIKFVFEAVVWHEIAKKYSMLNVNEPLQVIAYQKKGLSDSDYEIWYIEGLLFSYKKLLSNKTYPWLKYPKIRFQTHLHVLINSMLLNSSIFCEFSFLDKLANLVIYPRAYYSYCKIKNKIKDDKKNSL